MRGAGEDVLMALLYGFQIAASHPLQWLRHGFPRMPARHSSLLRQLQRFEGKGLVRRETVDGGEDRWDLTAIGRACLAGRRDPEQEWLREWDGKWRLLCFDLPADRPRQRGALRRVMRSLGLGTIQRSVWISWSSESVEEAVEAALAIGYRRHPDELLIVEQVGRLGGFEHGEVVNVAWPFDRINAGYDAYLRQVERFIEEVEPKRALKQRLSPSDVGERIGRERQLWTAATRADPLLPRPLHPEGYRGPEAASARARWISAVRALALSE